MDGQITGEINKVGKNLISQNSATALIYENILHTKGMNSILPGFYSWFNMDFNK